MALMFNRNKGEIRGNSNSIPAAITLLGSFWAWEELTDAKSILIKNNQVKGRFGICADLGIIGSILGTCLTSLAMNNGKMKVRHVLYSIIVGYITVSGSAGFMVHIPVAFVIGFLGGIIMHIVYYNMSRCAPNSCKYYDTVGVFYWHGLTGVLGSINKLLFSNCLFTSLATPILPSINLHLNFLR